MKLFTRKLKRKYAPNLVKALQPILKKDRPLYFWVDQGGEFINADVKRLMDKYSITMYTTFSVINVTIAERLIRSLMGKISRIWTHRVNQNWVDVLDSVTTSYNNKIHSSTGGILQNFNLQCSKIC